MLAFLKLKDIDRYDLDDPRRTLEHREIILGKKFLKQLYIDWYQVFVKEAANFPGGKMIELGSGGGFLKELMPEVITSDILQLSNCDMIFSALDMPFEDNSISCIFMIDVFHHIPDSAAFLKEADRVLVPGGKIVMQEPASTLWGRLIYKNFHHEPFNPEGDWTIPAEGPMSNANGALPWIVFDRDRKKFEALFPRLHIKSIRKHTPLRYLLSGGVSMKQLVPSWSFGALSFFEKLMGPFTGFFSMFQTIVVEKKTGA
jgi:SAM-dependent methyltransferase